MNRGSLLLLLLAGGFVLGVACATTQGPVPEPEPAPPPRSWKAEMVHDITIKPLGSGLAADPNRKMDTADNACGQEDLGLCGCLPPDAIVEGRRKGIISWNIPFDVACCHGVGNEFALYSCGGDAKCDDAGDTVVCVK